MLLNRQYGILNYQTISYAPRNIQIDNTGYIPGQHENYIQAGYKKIVNTPYPDDGKYYQSSGEERGEEIVQVGTETDPPEPPEPVEDPLLDLEEMTIDHEYRLTLLELGVE